jgi:hypothetical protein
VDRLSLRILGGLDVEGLEPPAVGSRKARALVRLLALARGRPVATRDLIDALWGDAAPANPAEQVAVLASRLRRTLGRDRIEHVEHSYRLHYDWLDVAELEAVTAERAPCTTSPSGTGIRRSASNDPGSANQPPYVSRIAAAPRRWNRQLGTVASRVTSSAQASQVSMEAVRTAARKRSTGPV